MSSHSLISGCYRLLRKRARRPPKSTPPSECLPNDISIDEEQYPDYDPDEYYAAYPGEVLDNRFQLIAKLGYGRSSTVWLAKDLDRSVNIHSFFVRMY